MVVHRLVAGGGREESRDESRVNLTGMAFIAAAIAMLIAVIPAGIVLCRGELEASVVAYEFISSVIVMVLALLAQGFRRSGEFELPVLLAVLMLGSGLVFVRALERWL